tara:strand:+ start:1258 stop:2724 length:1467 start_codon:yes stop_codon:yes gene_type:complete
MEEPKIRYYLEPKRGEGLAKGSKYIIMAEVNYRNVIIKSNGSKSYKPFRISIKKSIKPEQFGRRDENYKFDELIFSKSQKNDSTIRRVMMKLEDAVFELYKEYDKKGLMPIPADFKNAVEVSLDRKSDLERPQPTILEYIYKSIAEDNEKLKIEVEGARKANTIKTYNTVAKHVENYELATGEKLLFETFNEQIYWRFFEVLDDILKGKIEVHNPNQPKKKRKQDYGFLKSSLRKIQVSFLKVFKQALKKEGIRSGFQPDQDGLLVSRKGSSKSLYITENELKQIISSDCSHSPSLQIAKEYIIIGCLTGARNESMMELYNEPIHHNKDDGYNFSYVRSRHNKTQTEVFIPLLKPVQDIVNSHNCQFPKFYSNAKTNANLKSLFKFLEIERPVVETLDTYRSGKLTKEIPMHKLVSTHDAKKTFTTILAGYQLPESIISSITHPDKPSQNKMFQVYDNRNMLDKAKQFVDEINKIDSEVYKFQNTLVL